MYIKKKVLFDCTLDDNESPLSQINRQDDYIYVSDKLILVRLNKNKIEESLLSIAITNKLYNFKEICNNVLNTEEITVTNDMFFNTFNNIPRLNKTVCPACGGTKTVNYCFEYDYHEYFHEFECPVCNGTGYEYSEEPKIDFQSYIRINKNVCLSAQYAEKIYNIIKEYDLKLTSIKINDNIIHMFFEDDSRIVVLGKNIKNSNVNNIIVLK